MTTSSGETANDADSRRSEKSRKGGHSRHAASKRVSTRDESGASRNSASRAQRLAKRSEEELKLKTASGKGRKHSKTVSTPTTRPGAQAENDVEGFAVARKSRSAARNKDRKSKSTAVSHDAPARRHDEDRKSKGRAKSLSKPNKPGVQDASNDFDPRARQAERKSRRSQVGRKSRREATPEDVMQLQRDQRSAREVHAKVVAEEDGIEQRQLQQIREELREVTEENRQELEEQKAIQERNRKKYRNLCILGGVVLIAVIVTAVIVVTGLAKKESSSLPNPGGSNETVLDQISVPTIPPVEFLTPAPTGPPDELTNKYDPPSEEDCLAIRSKAMVEDQDKKTVANKFFDLDFDITLIDSSESEAWKNELMEAIQGYLVPDLAGCTDSTRRGVLELFMRGNRKLVNSIKYIIVNGNASNIYEGEEACEDGAQQPCIRVTVTLELSLKGNAKIPDLISLIYDVLGSDRTGRTLKERLQLLDKFADVEVVGISNRNSSSSNPTFTSSVWPSESPSVKQSGISTAPPTGFPSLSPSIVPSTPRPSAPPTPNPTFAPVVGPTPPPTLPPTRAPTPNPTPQPTSEPTLPPTRAPTPNPTPQPTPEPTTPPTIAPTPQPTPEPTTPPTKSPTPNPTLDPSTAPTKSPTRAPSDGPTISPTEAPSCVPNLNKPWKQLGIDLDGETANAFMGRSVSLSADGTRVAIGAYYLPLAFGKTRIYDYKGSTWVQVGQDIDGEAAGDYSGLSVSLSDDGSRVAIGASSNDGNGENSGHTRIFDYSGSNWVQVGQDIDGEAAGDNSGYSVSLSGNGSRVAIGAIRNAVNGVDTGHTRIFQYNGSNWVQLGGDIDGDSAGDLFGLSLSLSDDGSRIAIGAPHHNDPHRTSGVGYYDEFRGQVKIFEYQGSNWVKLGQDLNGETRGNFFGFGVSLSGDGSRVAAGAYGNNGVNGLGSGHARIFQYVASQWVQLGGDIDGEVASDTSGRSVSLSRDGSRVAIGSDRNCDCNGIGSARIFEYVAQYQIWHQVGRTMYGEGAGNSDKRSDHFGWSVSLSADGTTVAIGGFRNGANGPDSGHARILEYNSC